MTVLFTRTELCRLFVLLVNRHYKPAITKCYVYNLTPRSDSEDCESYWSIGIQTFMTPVILIAPNVSEQMGGEAIKALQIFDTLSETRSDVYQITHERCEEELSSRLGREKVSYIRDDFIALFLWNSVIFRWFLNYWFLKKAINLAESMAIELSDRPVIVWQTEPNSPVLPRPTATSQINVAGPINGNIYLPLIFKNQETPFARLRRVFHFPMQKLHRRLFNPRKKFDLILSAGGKRTRDSLLEAGYDPETLLESLDCGIRPQLLERPRVQQETQNFRFLHYGRLVFHKGTALAIKAVAQTKQNVELDIIGRGPELENCKKLAKSLNVADRVHFIDWFENHEDLFDSFYQYRGFILPSLEDANGIVVQEVMACGVPPICLDWGGPQLLIRDGTNGYLVEPKNQDYIVSRLAQRLDELGLNSNQAEGMSIAAREAAQSWSWPVVMQSWISQIDQLSDGKKNV